VLVTGGAGFIGSHLTERLVRDGHEVVVIDNMSTGRRQNLQGVLHSRAVRLINGDIRHRPTVSSAMRKVDAVTHLAAVISVPYSVSHPDITNQVNVAGTLNLLDIACRRGVSGFVNISSCAIYGEAKYLPIDEDHPKSPLSPYAASKLCAETYCEEFNRTQGLPTTTLRLFNVYGPRQERNPYAGVMVQFRERLKSGKPLMIYGDGKQTRDFVHVRDVVDAICASLESKRARGKAYNIGSGQATSVEALAGLMLKVSRMEAQPVHSASRSGDILHSQADIRRAREELGYEPKVSLEEGLRDLLED